MPKGEASLTKPNRGHLVSQLVVFLSGRPEELSTFFALTGFVPNDLRSHLHLDEVQTGILDYVGANEPLLVAFCEEAGHEPEQVAGFFRSSTSW